MVRVLFTASTFSHIISFHLPYIRAMRDMGWRVDVAAGGEPREEIEAESLISLPFEKKMTSLRNLSAMTRLRSLMHCGDYDIVICHTSLAAFFTRMAAVGLKNTKLINVCHGYLFDDRTGGTVRSVLLAAEKLTAARTDLLLTMNDYDFRLARDRRLGARVEKIPGMGVDFDSLRMNGAGRKQTRQAYGISAGDYVLVYAAEFSRRKNQEMLIRAMTGLRENVKLLLPGAGEKLEECRRLVSSLGLDGRVIMPGYIDNMAELYSAADAAVSASRSEGLPFNVMEAMACELPMVVSDVKGNSDLVEDGVNGLTYTYGDADGFRRAVERLAAEPDWAAQLGRRGAETVRRYSIERVLPEVMDMYMSVAAAETGKPETVAIRLRSE